MPATSMVEHDHRIRAARPARRARAAATQSPAAASIRISPRRSHAMPLFRHRTALLLLSLLLACPAVLAAASTPRAQVAGVAPALEDHYFAPTRGRAIAEGLRSAADPGRSHAQTSTTTGRHVGSAQGCDV